MHNENTNDYVEGEYCLNRNAHYSHIQLYFKLKVLEEWRKFLTSARK